MKFQGKMNFLIIIIALFFGAVINLSADGLPGADAPEGFPNGCIDCHSTTSGNDYSLKASLSKYDDHPSITKIVNNIPSDCLMCHGEGSYGGELKNLIHETHLENNDFTENYGSNCMSCHSDFPKDGNPFIKVGPKNW